MRKSPISVLRRLGLFLAVVLAAAACGTKSTPSVQKTAEIPANPLITTNMPGFATLPAGIPASGSITTTPEITPSAASANNAVWQAIRSSQEALLHAPAFQSQTTITNQNTGAIITNTLEYQSPDRLRLKSNNLDTIVISSTTYTNDHQAGWKISPVSLGGVAGLLEESNVLQAQATDILQGKILGTEQINGTQAQIYQYNTTREGATSTVKVWIGNSDHLPRKVEIESEAASVRTLTTIIYSYQDIEIQSPVMQK